MSVSSLKYSELPLARSTRSFARRWHRGAYRAFLEAQALPPGGPVSLLDRDGATLASFRTNIPAADNLLHTGAITFGEPALARLTGDIATLPDDFIDQVRMLTGVVADFEGEMEELSHHALERYRELSLLYDFSEKTASATALGEVLDVVLRKAVHLVRASGAGIFTLDPSTGTQRQLASFGTVPDVGAKSLLRVMESGRTLVGVNGESLREVEGDAWLGVVACIPLRTGGHTAGALVVMAGPGRELRVEDQRLLTALASLAATRIEQVTLTEENTRRRELVAIGHLASAIVHDVKNPLTAMRGFAELIQMSQIPAAEHFGLAGQIISNADRVWTMVEEILHFASGNRASLNLRPTSGKRLNELFASVLPSSYSKRARIHLDLSAVGTVTLDEHKIERVVVNLVRNACEAIVGTGTVQVFGEDPGEAPDTFRIIVQDDGPGIPLHVRTHMFDPFVTQHHNTYLIFPFPGQNNQ